MEAMRDSQCGVAALTVLGVILIVLGIVAIIIAPQIMNSAEIGTLRKVGGGIAGLGALAAIAGMNRKA